jgi:hypothetical protein
MIMIVVIVQELITLTNEECGRNGRHKGLLLLVFHVRNTCHRRHDVVDRNQDCAICRPLTNRHDTNNSAGHFNQ